MYFDKCESRGATINNGWSLVPGWPAVTPTSFSLFSSKTTLGSFGAYATPIIVAWKDTDQTVVDHLKEKNIVLPSLPTPVHGQTGSGHKGMHIFTRVVVSFRKLILQ
jgi:hypothetical protein